MLCHLPWAQVFINANGVVAPCCAPMELGNLTHQDIGDVFSGKGYGELRSDLASHRRSVITEHCDGCYALKKYQESGYTFEAAYPVTADTEAGLVSLEASHPDFVANYRQLREAYRTGESPPAGTRPIRLEVQLGEHCDIRCIMCWQDHTRPRMLRREIYDQIADIIPYAQDVLFTGGEPTIFKQFWELVDQFREKANPTARLQLLTHGQHLKENLHRFEGIPHVGFCVNVDGPTQSTYEHIRAGSNWDKLNESLAAVAEARQHQPGWGLNMTFLLMRSNIELIEESLDMAEKYGAQWSCGMLAGEYSPVGQCRSYFEENLFRFDHLGYSKQDIIDRLRAALPRADRHPWPIARAGIEATIQQVEQTQQMHVSATRAAEMRALPDDNQLSRAIRQLVVESAQKQAASAPIDGPIGAKAAASAEIQQARNLLDAGRPQEAAAVAQETLDVLKTLNEPSDIDQAHARLVLGRSLGDMGSDDAADVLRQAWEQLGALFGKQSNQAAEAALALGRLLNSQQRFDEAVEPLRDAYAAYIRLYGKQEDSSYVAVAASELGKGLVASGKFDEAVAPLRKAVRMYEVMWGKAHGIAAMAAYDLATALDASVDTRDEAASLLAGYLEAQRDVDADSMLTSMSTQRIASLWKPPPPVERTRWPLLRQIGRIGAVRRLRSMVLRG